MQLFLIFMDIYRDVFMIYIEICIYGILWLISGLQIHVVKSDLWVEEVLPLYFWLPKKIVCFLEIIQTPLVWDVTLIFLIDTRDIIRDISPLSHSYVTVCIEQY